MLLRLSVPNMGGWCKVVSSGLLVEFEKLGGGKNGCMALLFMLYPTEDLSDLESLVDFEDMLPCPMSFIRLCGFDLLIPIFSGPS